MKASYNLDRVELGSGVILLQGWVVPENFVSLQLILHGRDPQGNAWAQHIPLNRERPDVIQALGMEPGLCLCGFFYYSAAPAGQILELCAHSENEKLTIYSWPETSQENSKASAYPGTHLQTWRHFAGRSWTLLRSGQWKGFKDRAVRHARSAWQVMRLAQKPTADVVQESARSWDCLVVDHDLGGGANQYRKNQLMQELLAQPDSRVALITFSVLSLQYVVYRVLSEQRQEPVTKGTWEQIKLWIQQSQFAHIFYNNAVSFPQALSLVESLHAYKQSHQCQLTVAMHDYFPICPSQHLLEVQGRYCQLPDMATCQSCLARSDQAMVSLYRHHGMPAWRDAWARLLAVADEVRIFDPSAQTTLHQVYPQLVLPWSLRPHHVAELKLAEQQKLQHWQAQKKRPSGRIGIVGSITSAYKGMEPVAQLVRTIAQKKLPFEVVVLGECVAMPGLPLRSTGFYRASELTDLIIKNDIDMFFFSSVGPETFSYVLHELERYGLPVAAFDLGAQTTFLSYYPQGIRLDLSDDADQVLRKIEPYLS